jgi:hypothetical protein
MPVGLITHIKAITVISVGWPCYLPSYYTKGTMSECRMTEYRMTECQMTECRMSECRIRHKRLNAKQPNAQCQMPKK